MHRLPLSALAFLALLLIAAAPGSFLTTKPRVVVYPFTATGTAVDREASSRLATVIATEMASTGRVTVVAPPPGTERKDYLAVARSSGCDYYIAGFISPLGDGVSVVEQLVSTSTGIVVYSSSTQIKTYADATGQGDQLAQAASLHANRGLASFGTPPPAPSASPTAAPSSAADVDLGRLFGRMRRGTPAPKATSAPRTTSSTATEPPKATVSSAPAKTVAAASGSGYVVLPVGGTADAALRTQATEIMIERTRAERADSPAAACANGHEPRILSGALTVSPDAQGGENRATFEMAETDCAKKTLFRRSFSESGTTPQNAAVAALNAAFATYLSPPQRRRR
ncbi:MAG: hypothetical protein JOZ24_09770 [Candidatus Eremiobacteraeota bacterium]|nr:hypothetical protein [Candidatus Eremiobacteraeota bacterium]